MFSTVERKTNVVSAQFAISKRLFLQLLKLSSPPHKDKGGRYYRICFAVRDERVPIVNLHASTISLGQLDSKGGRNDRVQLRRAQRWLGAENEMGKSRVSKRCKVSLIQSQINSRGDEDGLLGASSWPARGRIDESRYVSTYLLRYLYLCRVGTYIHTLRVSSLTVSYVRRLERAYERTLG